MVKKVTIPDSLKGGAIKGKSLPRGACAPGAPPGSAAYVEVGETATVSESWQLYTDVTDHDRISDGEGVGNKGKGRESCLKV